MTDTSESVPSRQPPVSSSNNKLSTGHDQAVAMDNMYRFTRHIYDLSRRYYLLGRDQLLEELVTGPDTATLEVGCGTARNLIKLGKRTTTGALYGLDASHEMLETASKSISSAGLPHGDNPPIMLRQGLAEELDGVKMFGRDEPFDTIFLFLLPVEWYQPGLVLLRPLLRISKQVENCLLLIFGTRQIYPPSLHAGSKSGLHAFMSTIGPNSTKPFLQCQNKKAARSHSNQFTDAMHI
jgi:SAM-dependent methyltransferase